MDTIRQRIRARRMQLGLSQQQVADALRVTYQAVQKWEKVEGSAPKRARMQALANLLQTTVAWLETGAEKTYAASPTFTAEEPKKILPTFQWPFKIVTLDRIRALDERDIGFLEGKLLAAIEQCEAALQSKQQSNGHP